MSNYYVYILSSRRNGTLYVGITNDVAFRTWQHKAGKGGKFTSKYGVNRLVYIEPHSFVIEAIKREKRLKNWKRTWKIGLIEKHNPNWDDLFDTLNA